MSNNKNPFWNFALVLTLIGTALATHLTYLHRKVYQNPDYDSFCNINAKYNCVSVAQSKYSILFNVPVSVWGLFGYGLILLVLFIGLRQAARTPAIYGVLGLLVTASVCMSAYYAYVSHVYIKTLCPTCIGTYVVNGGLLILYFMALRYEDVGFGEVVGDYISWQLNLTSILLLLVVAGLAAGLFYKYPKYWNYNANYLQQQIPQMKMPTGIEDGHAWIGAETPIVTIVEFADYECPYCMIAHFQLRRVLAKYSKTVRLVHRHYPLDQACNPKIKHKFHAKACLFARAAHCAGTQNKFWQMNDLLYSNKAKYKDLNDLKKVAQKIGMDTNHFQMCINNSPTRQAIMKDLQAGIRLKLKGTPSIFLHILQNAPVPLQLPIKEDVILRALERARIQRAAQPTAPPRPTMDRAVMPVRRAPAPLRTRPNPPVPRRDSHPSPKVQPTQAIQQRPSGSKPKAMQPTQAAPRKALVPPANLRQAPKARPAKPAPTTPQANPSSKPTSQPQAR